jgi:pimeloyl-ACP methyl ester carboxylesterase
MSAITVNGDLVHYEVLGRGRPVILIHGWLGSWRYWVPTLQQLQNNYRVYALDLYGFGDSAKNPDKYSLEHQITLLDDFMTELGLPKAALIGHGLGALVAAEYARRYQDRVARLLIVSAPLFDPGDLATRQPVARRVFTPSRPTLPALTPADHSADAPTIMSASAAMRAALLEAARARAAQPAAPPTSSADPGAPPDVTLARPPDRVTTAIVNPMRDVLMTNPLEALLGRCFRRTEPTYEKLAIDIAKSDPRAVTASVATFDAGWTLDTLRLLQIPIVVVHGVEDGIIPVPNEEVWNYVTTDKDNLLLPIQLPGVRHFPMLEDERFFRIANEFLELADINRITLKERWRRRTR